MTAATLAAIAAIAAPASTPYQPVSDKWAVPIIAYADSDQIDVWTLNEAWPQIPRRGHRFRTLVSAANRNRVPYSVLAGVYAVYSGLGHFSDWFGLSEIAGPPRSTGSFRRDANLAAKELRRLYRMLWNTDAL